MPQSFVRLLPSRTQTYHVLRRHIYALNMTGCGLKIFFGEERWVSVDLYTLSAEFHFCPKCRSWLHRQAHEYAEQEP